MPIHRSERRSHARFPHSFELHGATEAGGIVARMVARDLSLGGLYCSSSHDLPEMSRVAVRLLLPERKKRGDARPLDLQAVVVRRREIGSATGNGRFELALFFTSLTDAQKERLARFLSN